MESPWLVLSRGTSIPLDCLPLSRVDRRTISDWRFPVIGSVFVVGVLVPGVFSDMFQEVSK